MLDGFSHQSKANEESLKFVFHKLLVAEPYVSCMIFVDIFLSSFMVRGSHKTDFCHERKEKNDHNLHVDRDGVILFYHRYDLIKEFSNKAENPHAHIAIESTL